MCRLIRFVINKMSVRAVGLVFCFVSFVALAVSVGIPYWSYVSQMTVTSYNGLWQTCWSVSSLTRCSFNDFGGIVRWDAVRGLEAAACLLGLVGTILAFVAVCSNKSANMYLAAGIIEEFAAGLTIAGVINYGQMNRALQNAHACFYLNIIGGLGLCIGGISLMRARRNVDEGGPQSGQVLQSHNYQQQTHHQGQQYGQQYGYQQPAYHQDVSIAMQRKY